MPRTPPEPATEAGRTLDFSDLVELARFPEEAEAARLTSTLREAGIRAVPLDFDPRSGEEVFRVLVAPKDLEAARGHVTSQSRD